MAFNVEIGVLIYLMIFFERIAKKYETNLY